MAKAPDHATQERFLRRAIEMAYDSMNTSKGRPFGAVIVRDGEIVAESGNEVLARMDITAHAEILTIGKATRALNKLDLSDCDIYVTSVPCPMCMTGIYWSRIRKLYYAGLPEDHAAIGFGDDHMYRELGKPLAERSLASEHVASVRDEARACYGAWRAKTAQRFG